MKKKKKFLIVTILCSILILGSVAFGQGDIQVYVNNQKIDFPDAAPYIANNSTLVPVRFIAESLGAKVEWSQPTQEVTITKDYKQIVLKVGEKIARVGDKVIELDTNAEIKDSRTFVPLRFISETFDAKVEWVAETRAVLINTGTNSSEIIDEIIDNKEILLESKVKYVDFISKDKYIFDIYENTGTKFITSDFLGTITLIKDGSIIEQLSPYPSNHLYYYPVINDLKAIDYLGLYYYGHDTIEIVESPFK